MFNQVQFVIYRNLNVVIEYLDGFFFGLWLHSGLAG